MPSVDVGDVLGLAMSKNGKLLAVGGNNRMFWNHNNHRFAISRSAGKLYVFTVTGTSATAAPGSPSTISSPNSLIVQPLTGTDGDWDDDQTQPQ